MKIVIIGGVAAGAKAAAKTRRLLPDSQIDIYTDDTHISYSACGLPYYIEGNFEDYKKLIIRTPEDFQKVNINVHIKNKVTKIIPNAQKILVKDLETETVFPVEYDKLVIATGARPFLPNIQNIDKPNVYKLRTLEDGIAIREKMLNSEHITIIGGGYIGLELLEACVKNNKKVTIIENSSHLMPNLDKDIADLIMEHIEKHYSEFIKIILNDRAIHFNGQDEVTEVLTEDGESIKTNMVILCTGVRPCTKIAESAGIELGVTNAIKVNSRMETNIENIYACGDCAESTHIVSNAPVWIPLGSNANKTGRCTAVNLSGYKEDFEGVLGSAVTRFISLTISSTGLSEKEAIFSGFDPISVIVTKRDKAGYMPEVQNITIKLIADKRTHKLLGGQAIGCGDADKRINSLSIGLLNGITVEELLGADITYAPPYSTTIDPLIDAARILLSKF